MRFGHIDTIILFGGGQRLVNFLSLAKNYKTIVLSAPRLLNISLDQEAVTVEQYFMKHGIGYYCVEDLNNFDINPYINAHTLGISFGAPWIFKPEFINKFKGRLINAHGARLPKNRGAATFSWQIMRRDHGGCHLFHIVDGGIDTGTIIFKNEFDFPETCRTPKDYKNFFMAGEMEFFKEFMRKLEREEDFEEIPQDEEKSTYFPRLSTAHHGWIDWSWRTKDIVQFISAFDNPHEGASTFLNGKRVFIKDAAVDMSEGGFHPFMAGLIIRTVPGSILVAVKDGGIMLRSLRDEHGTDIMNAIRPGHRLATPISHLDAARAFTAVYTPQGLKE